MSSASRRPGPPPDAAVTAPSVTPDAVELAEVRLALFAGSSFEVQLTVDETTASAGRRFGWLVIRDQEDAPVAAMQVDAANHGTSQPLSGPITPVDGADHGPFAALRRRPAEISLRKPLAVIGHDPPDATALAAVDASRTDVLFIVLDGPRSRPGPALADTVRAVRSLAAGIDDGRTTEVVVVPAPEYADKRDDPLRHRLAAAYGAPAVVASMTADRSALLTALDGDDDPAGLPAASLAAWRRFRPARSARGLVVLFTGLSGSGKSTLARALTEALAEQSTRKVTLLDGDVVRTMLSAGLGFSREDRDRNVLRIGYVAAEIARHGGTAICAPIAPFADTRWQVREMATANGDFVLVHVATPLEECERRDRKGLYARARAGEIPEFTGISSPYEPPGDADLVIDTSTIPVDEATARVVEFLRGGGWLAASHRPPITR